MNVSKNLGAIIAVIMVVSMVAVGATAVGAVGTQSAVEDTTLSTSEEVGVTGALTDSFRSSGAQSTPELDSQSAQVADQLEDASGETTVLLKVDRNIQVEESLPSEFSSEELEQDSEATLQPVVDSVNSLPNAEVTQRIVIGNALVVEIDLDQHDIDQLATIPGVEAVAPNIKFEHPAQLDESTGAVSPSDVTVPDPDAEYTWGLQQIGVPSFDEQFDVRGEGANVTIIDDGISDGDHPDLEFAQKVNIVDNEINVGAIGVTDNAHGEHVAGTATGALDPAGDVPRYGVAPNASLTKINVFEGTPGASFANILTGVDYAVTERNADVAGLSLGAGGPVSTVANIVDAQMREAKTAGTLVTVSAGNEGDFFQGGDEGAPVSTPATEFDAFSVGASADQPVVINTTEAFPPSIPSSIAAFTGSNNDITQFSSGAIVSDRRSLNLLEGTVGVGDFYPDDYPRQYVQPDVAAPGLFVLSSGPLGNDAGAPGVNATSDGYSWTQGTSMAQPHVAGAVALIQSATEEDLGPQEISAALTETAEKPDNASENFPSIGERDIRYGAGIINVTAAALAAQNMTEATGTVTDDAGEPVTGASLETEEGALVRTTEGGEYSLASTESTPNVTVNAYGFDPVTEELTSDDQTFTLDRDLTVTEVVQGQPNITESGGEFTIVADVASVETFTLELSDSSSFQVGVDERDLTASIAGVGEIPFGQPVSLGNFTGLAEITVSISETADVATGDQLLLDHTFEGSGESVSVTTGPTTLVDAAGAVSSVSIDADFIGTINDQPTTTVTAEGILKDGEPSTGDRLTFTIGGEPVATNVTSGGVATAEVNAEALDLGPQEDVTVDVLEFEAAQTDTVDIVDEVADLEEGFNLLSVPQPATLTTQDVSSLNVWDSEDETYDAVTSPEFDTASDLHDGLYVDASSDNARLGFTFNEDVPVGGTQDVNTDWNLLGANFPLDSEDIGTSTTIENDLTGVDAAALELFRGDFGEFLTPNSQVGPFEAYWAFNPATSADERGIASPSYDEGDRRDVLGQGESDFQPTITNIETTSVEDADDEITLDDRDVVGASEQVVLVDVTVENNGNGTDVQFVTLEVAPQLGSGSGFELADQTGIELGPGESGDVTLAFVASQDDVSPLPPFFVPDDVAIEVTTEDGDAEDVGIPFDEGGITVEDQALSTDGEFVVENVDVAGHGTVQLVDANDNVLDSVEFAQGINEEVTFTVDDPANVTDDVTVRVLDDNELEELTSETVAVLDTRFTVSNNAPEFALVNETVDVPVTVTSNVAVPEDDVSVNFSVGGTDAGSQTVDLGAFGTETVSFPVDTTGLSVGDTVEHTATSPDDSDTRTLTIAEATLGFTDQSLNADGEVLVEDVTADEDQTIVVTDTDLNVVGEVDVADITTPGERGIDDEDVLVDVTGTSAGTHIAHVVADDFTVPGEGPGLVNQAANITVSTVDLADINNQTVSEAALPVEVVSSVTVDSEVVDAVGDRNSDYTVEIRQGGTVVGASDNLSDVSNGLTIELDDPVVVDEAQPEQTFTLTAVLVDQNGNEFDVSAGTNLDDDGFPVLTGNLDSAADEESFTVTVSGAENVNLPDQALGVANGSDAVLVNNIAADAGQFVVITPADDNNNILGVTQFDETVSGGERIVEFDQEVSAGEFRAHITTDTGLLGDDGALVTDTGVVSEAELDFQDQDFVGLTSEVTVATADLLDGIGNTTEFEIAIHQTTEDGGVGSIIGETDKDLTGANSDVTVSLDSTIDSNTTLVAMLHFSDGNDLGSPILQVAGDSVVPVLDSANLTKVESDQTFSDQALTTGEILIEDVRANQTSAVVVTYPNDGNLTIAGLTTGVSSTTGQEVSVTINDAGGFPGEHTVHIIPESVLSQTTYSAGDNVSSETAANITSQESATVFDASVTIDDQAFEDSTSTFNVTTSDLQPATASDYVVVVHNQTGQPAEAGPADTDVGPALGATGVLNGSQENATVNLFEPLDETTDVLVMIHFPNAAGTGPGLPIPTLNGGSFGITDGSAGTITDTATVTIEQAEGGNLEFSNQALGSNGDVVVENVQPVDAVEVTTDQAFDPQNDFLVLTEGTEVTGENDIIDFVQLSNVANGTDVALNATGASPGTHTVVLHEPNEAGTGPDPDAPRTNASSGEVVNATATVFGGSVTVENQTLEQGTDALDNITVQTAELLDGSADGATFTLNVTSGGTSLGTTTATGANTDVTVPLDEPLDRGTTDVTVTVEVNGAAVQQASGTSFVDLQDGATIDVVAAEYTVDTVSLNESTIAEGENINASVTVTNIGEIDGEKDITLRVLDDGNATGVSQTRENVQVFSSETRTLPFNGFDVSGLAGGDYTVEVEVPADNNSNSVGLTIQVPAEFTVSINESASDVDVVGGQNVTVNATVENIGDLSGTQNVTLSINRTTLDTEEVTLSGGANTTVELTAPVTKEDDGTDAVVTTADFDTGVDDTDNVTLSVEAPVTNVVSGTEFSTLRSALQNADNGDSLEVAGKTFTPTDDLFVTNDNLTVTGAGTAETTIEANITVTGNDNLLEQFTIEGNYTDDGTGNNFTGAEVTSASPGGFIIIEGNDALISNTQAENVTVAGSATITNSNVSNNAGTGTITVTNSGTANVSDSSADAVTNNGNATLSNSSVGTVSGGGNTTIESPDPADGEIFVDNTTATETTAETFSGLQNAVNSAAEGATLTVGPGTFDESVTIDVEGLTIEGPNAGTPGDSDARGAEAVITGGSGNTPGVQIVADNVTLDGLQVENAGRDGIRFGPDTVPSNVIIQNSVVTDVTGAVGGKSAGNGIQFQFSNVANETAQNIQILDNEISNITTPNATNAETIATGVNVLPRGNNVDLEVDGNRFSEITAGNSGVSAEARGVSLDTQDDNENGFGRVDGAVVSNNTFNDITAPGVVRAVALFEDTSLAPREGPVNVSVTRNNFTNLSGAFQNTTGAVFVGGYETLGTTVVTENNFESGGVLRFAENQPGFTPANAEDLDATRNWWGNQSGPSGAGPGVGNPVSENVTFDPWLNAPVPGGQPVTDGDIDVRDYVADNETVAGGTLNASATVENGLQGVTTNQGRALTVEHVLLANGSRTVLNSTSVDVVPGTTETVSFVNSPIPDSVSSDSDAEHRIAVRDEFVNQSLVIESTSGVAFNDQVLGTNASGSDAVLVEDVSTSDDATVVVTYENNAGDLVIAGLTEIQSNNLGSEDVTVVIEDTGGFPGEHVAHLIPTSDLSTNYSAGDTVSNATADSILDSETATVFDGSVTIDDQQFEGSTSQVTVDASDLQPAGASEYKIVVHNQTGVPAGGVGPPIGFSANLTGAETNVPVPLTETLNTTTDVLTMLHFPGNPTGPPIPTLNGTAFGIGDAQAGTVTDTATVEIQQAQGGNVEFQSQVLGTNSGSAAVLAENVTAVDVVTIDNAFDPQDDFLVLTDGTGVTGPDNVIDAVQLSELNESADVALNATGATPGQHTVVLHEPNATGTGPDPDAPRTDASTGEVINATATVFDGSVNITDQQFEGSTSQVTVDASDLQPAGASEYKIVVHNQTGVPAGGVGPAIGFSANLTGAETDVTIPLTETLNTTTDVLTMLHFPGNPTGPPIPTLNGTDFGIGDAQAGTVTDTATVEIQQAQGGNVEFQSQAIGTSSGSAAVLAENVTSVDVVTVDNAFDPQEDFLVLTDGTGVTGPNDVLDFVQLSEFSDGSDVALNATGATPGQHTVVLHEPNATGTGPDPSAPRTDASTGEVVNASATVFTGSVDITDQQFETNTSQVTVDASDLQPAGASEYKIVVHNQTGVPAGGVGPAIGFSANLTGAETNVTIPLTETLNTTTDVLTMLHFPGNPTGLPIPTLNGTDFGIGDAQAGTVTDTATVEIQQAQGGNVEFQSQVLGTNNGSAAVLAENVQSVDVVTVDNAFDPQDDFLVLTEGTEVTGPDDVLDFVQLSELNESADVALNATGATPGQHTVLLHEPNEAGTAPDPDAPRTDASTGEVIGETATVFDGSVNITDQSFVGSTDEITVDSSDLQADGPAEYRIVVHDQTRANSSAVGPDPDDVGPPLGFSDVLNGSESTTTIGLNQNITSTQDVLVMIHFPGNGSSGPGDAIPVLNDSVFGFGDGQAGTITDTATVEINEPANFAVSINDDASTTEVTAGDDAVLNATIENTGDLEGTQTINFTVNGTNEGSVDVTNLAGGASEDVEFVYQTELADDGATAEVASDDDTATRTLTVTEQANFAVTINDDASTTDVTAGENAIINATIENTGGETATQTINFTVNGTNEGSVDVTDLAGGATEDVEFSYTTEAADDGATAEVASDNDTATRTLTVTEPANFTVTIDSVPSSVTVGDDIQVNYTVENVGDQQGTQDINFSVNGTDKGTESDVTLNGSETFSDSFTSTTSDSDTPEVTVAVSSANDTASETVTVEELTPANFTVSIDDAASETDVTAGEDAVINATIENTGGETATQTITFTVNGTNEGSAEVTDLDGGATETVEFSYTTEAADNGATAEVASDDDSDSTQLTVTDPANFAVTINDGASTTDVTAGENAVINATIENTGDEAATQTIEFTVGGTSQDSVSVNLAGGATETVEFTYTTEAADDGATAAVVSDDDSDSTQLTVTEPANFAVSINDAASTTEVTAGEDAVINATIENTGEETATQTIEFTVGGTSQDSVSVNLAGGATETVEFTYTTEAADDGATAAVASDDDSDSTQLTVTEPANFAVTINDGASTTDVTAGENAVINATIENTGDETATQTINFTVNGTNEGSVDVTDLTGGATETVEFTYTTEAADDGATAAVVSDDDSDSTQLTVTEPANFAVSINDAASTTEVTAGEDAVINATIENTGEETATQTINFTVNGTNEGSVDVTNLAGGVTEDVEFVYQTELADDGATVEVASDDDSDSTQLTVTEQANFTVTINDGASETDVTAGENAIINATIENTGDLEGTQTINFTVNGTNEGSVDVTNLAGGASEDVEFVYQTELADDGATAEVASDDDSDSTQLTVTEQVGAGDFTVAIVDQQNATIAGENQTFDVKIENVGSEIGQQDIELDWGNGTYTNTTSVTLDASNSTVETLSVTTDSDEFLGEDDVSVESLNDTATTGAQIIPERVISTDSAAPGDTVSVTVSGELDSPKNVSLIETFNRTDGSSDTAFPPATYNGSGFAPQVASFSNTGGVYSAPAGNFPESGSATLEFNYKITLPSGAAGEAFGFESDTSLFEIEGTEFSIGGDDAIAIVASSSTTQSAAVVAAP